MQKVISDTRVPVKIWASQIEDEAIEQVKNLANLPFIHSHVAVMPDAHAGKGSTIGSVIATKGAIIPAAVGVDIGCGMSAVKLPYTVDELGDLKMLRNSIERSVPVGFNYNREVEERAGLAFLRLVEKRVTDFEAMGLDLKRAVLQMGSLGGGNHFIEICSDLEGNAWVMLHSGSRNIGKCLAEIHIHKAQGIMKEYFINLPDPDLAYFAQGTAEFLAYIGDLQWAQDYARANRNEMMLRVLKDVGYHVSGGEMSPFDLTVFRVDCHHNYTQMEHHFGSNVWITRKGAVSAKAGEFGIVPGSMGAKSYIVRGLGNPDSFHSCSHGAGRTMSRTKAKKLFTKEDLARQTVGVECRKDADVIDEIPGAYKDIDLVMADQKDLVEVHAQLKQLICIKG